MMSSGFNHLAQLHSATTSATANAASDDYHEKYFSVDSSFLVGNPEVRAKIRQNIPEAFRNPPAQAALEQTPPAASKPDCPEYIKPPSPKKSTGGEQRSAGPQLPPYQRPPPPKLEAAVGGGGGGLNIENSNLGKSKQISGSVSWLEWTQQLQVYLSNFLSIYRFN